MSRQDFGIGTEISRQDAETQRLGPEVTVSRHAAKVSMREDRRE
jgi:hypothetical protein